MSKTKNKYNNNNNRIFELLFPDNFTQILQNLSAYNRVNQYYIVSAVRTSRSSEIRITATT